MQGLWNWLDTAPILDLLVAAAWFSIIAGLLICAAVTVYRERQYAKKRERLLALIRQDDEFSTDHNRPRVGR